MPDETTPTAAPADLEATDVSERTSPEDHREEDSAENPVPIADAIDAEPDEDLHHDEDFEDERDLEDVQGLDPDSFDDDGLDPDGFDDDRLDPDGFDDDGFDDDGDLEDEDFEDEGDLEDDEDLDDDLESEDAPEASFEDMNLDEPVLRALGDMGYERPMEVQSAVYGRIQAGHDVMVQSRTGTGKTAAFGIPMAQRILAESKGVQALILTPTRELGLQVANELQQIMQHKGLRVVPIYGGAPMKPQVEALSEGAQIVSGTPGRVLDHIRRRTLVTDEIRLLILDECDEMLSMGFQEEIDEIISHLPPREERQTLLFSATIPDEIRRIAGRHMREPETISLSSDANISVEEIDHLYYVVSGVGRVRDLHKVLKAVAPESAIVFCNTRDDTSMVAKFLQRQGYNALAISSDLTQRERERTMKRMRERKVQFLVATDVAARGIDISDLSHVINYTFPESPEMYVHRTGRTGRAGKRGTAISLVGPREIGSFYYLKLTYKIRPKECELPTEEELAVAEEGQRYQQAVRMVPDTPSEQYISLARRLWQSTEGERVVGALLQRLFEQPRDARAPSAHSSRRAAPRRDAGVTVEQERIDDRHGDDRRRRRSGAPDRERPRRGRHRRDREESSHRDRPPRNERGRRRRDRGDRRPAEGAPDAANAEPKEFWETWADEKEAASGDAEGRNGEDRAQRESGTTRLYLNLGKREQITADDVRSLLSEGLGDAAAKIGSVAVRNTHCYVRVPEELVDAIIENARGKSFKDREVVVERARR